MASAIYRGSVEELVGTSWNVPETVMQSGQAAKWIESQHRQAVAEEAAKAEAETRQQELLAARLEAQRRQAEAERVEVERVQTRSELEAGLKDELSELSQSVMAAGAAIVGKGELIEGQTREWEGRHEAMVANSEQVVADAAAQVEFANAVTQAANDQVVAELEAAQQRISSLESELRTTVATLQGPQGEKGERGLAGSAFAYADADPTRIDPVSGGQRFYGRGYVPGDTLARPVEGGLEIWRTADGKGWQRVDYRANKQELISQQLAVTDRSTQLTSSMVTTRAGGSGSGGEKLRSRMAPVNASVPLADSSNWRNTSQDPTAGQLFLEYTAADGSLAGRKGYAALSFVWEPSTSEFTEYALVGDISGSYTVQLNIQRSTAVVPGGITGSLPPGTTCTQVFGQLVPVPGGGASDTTQFLLSGVVLWAFSAQGTSIPANQSPETPLWTWQ